MHHMNESDLSPDIVCKIQFGYSNHGLVLIFFFLQMFKIIKKNNDAVNNVQIFEESWLCKDIKILLWFHLSLSLTTGYL